MVGSTRNFEELGREHPATLEREAGRNSHHRRQARRTQCASLWLRGEEDRISDIDFLVELKPGPSLFDLGGLQYELERLLSCPVDVITDRGLRPRIREHVFREAVPL